MARNTRVYLTGREFSQLEVLVAVPNGVHSSGGFQGYRKRWKDQLDGRRGHLTPRERLGATAPEDRWIDLDEASIVHIRKCIDSPKTGGWQRDVRDVFGGCEVLLLEEFVA